MVVMHVMVLSLKGTGSRGRSRVVWNSQEELPKTFPAVWTLILRYGHVFLRTYGMLPNHQA